MELGKELELGDRSYSRRKELEIEARDRS